MCCGERKSCDIKNVCEAQSETAKGEANERRGRELLLDVPDFLAVELFQLQREKEASWHGLCGYYMKIDGFIL